MNEILKIIIYFIYNKTAVGMAAVYFSFISVTHLQYAIYSRSLIAMKKEHRQSNVDNQYHNTSLYPAGTSG